MCENGFPLGSQVHFHPPLLKQPVVKLQMQDPEWLQQSELSLVIQQRLLHPSDKSPSLVFNTSVNVSGNLLDIMTTVCITGV